MFSHPYRNWMQCAYAFGWAATIVGLLCQVVLRSVYNMTNQPQKLGLVHMSSIPNAACMLPGASAKYCLLNSDHFDFDYFMARCKWKRDHSLVQLQLSCMDTRSEDCEGDAKLLQTLWTDTCRADGWLAFRTGPYVTHGDYSWTTLIASFNGSLVPYHGIPNLHAFSQYALGNIDESNSLIGYPPIHQHHYHAFGSYDFSLADMNNHGDNQCHSEDGGVQCLVRKAPSGTAWIMRDGMGVATQFNDVRPPPQDSLTSFIFGAFKSAGGSLAHLRQIVHSGIYFVPANGAFPTDDAGYTIPVGLEAVGWTNRDLRSFNVSVEAYMHTHADVVNDMWLFQGTPSAVFNNLTITQPAHNSLLVGADAVATVTSDVVERQRRGGAAQLVCSYIRASRPERVAGYPAPFYRKPLCSVFDDLPKSFVLVVIHGRRNPSLQAGLDYYVHAGARIYFLGLPGKVMVHTPGIRVQSLWGFDYEQETYMTTF